MDRGVRPELRLELRLERVAAAAILAALVVFSLQRVSVVDVPWHLATARLARALGHWPVENSFSHTFPEHPLYQQYPAFQAVLFGVYERWGWNGLSIFECLAWVTVFLLFVRWAGPFRVAMTPPLLWAAALFAVQRRISLRPELFTMLALAGMLHALSAFARGRRWAIAAVPVIHLAWVESHQLFPLSLLVQGLFIVHLVLARRGRLGVDRTDSAVPIWPAALALVISGGLCLATPLGLDVLDGMARTARSLAARRNDVAEFGRIWRHPFELSLALATAGPTAFVLWRARRCWSPFDLGLYLLSLALAVSAARGVLFLGIVSAAVYQRTAARLEAGGIPPLVALRPERRRLLRIEGALIAVILAMGGIYHFAIRPAPAWEGAVFGVGRSGDGWADGAVAFLRAHPPPGRMMNVPWASGNTLIWGLPAEPVFVDPRLESYPLEFLREIIDSYPDDARFGAVIDRYRPTWIFAERVHETVRKRLASLMGRGWEAVYRDAEVVILVRPGADTADYRAARRIELAPEAL